MEGTNIEAFKSLVKIEGLDIIASGVEFLIWMT